MFEKDAEVYADSVDGYEIKTYSTSDIEQAYQKGATDGYNKANEWHYVKDGDLPTEDLRQRTKGYYLTASKYK